MLIIYNKHFFKVDTKIYIYIFKSLRSLKMKKKQKKFRNHAVLLLFRLTRAIFKDNDKIGSARWC